jgi:hypothetical protein
LKKLAGAVFLLSVTAVGALAQPMMPPDAVVAADQRGAIGAEMQPVRVETRMPGTTREQIQAFRVALRARLAALHH